MSLPALFGLLTLLVGVPLNGYVTWRLWQLSRANSDLLVLRERALVATFVLVLTFVFGLIFVNNDTIPPPLSLVETKWITRAVLLGVAIVPALAWLRLDRSK